MVRMSSRVLCGLALCGAAFLLAPGAAQAQTNATCGALASGVANCPNAAYANGISYWNQVSGVTLTVPGTAGTATITASTTGWNGLDNGISIRTSAHVSEVRNVALTVGGTGTFVAIVQGSSPEANAWYRNHGILVSPLAANGSTVTVDVKSGVTIGTATTRMSHTGIEVVDVPGAVSVTSAARIYAGVRGIRIGNAAGTTMLDNRGAITAGGDGIYVRSWNSAGAVTVTNSGAIASAARGIYVEDGGSAGATTVTNRGAITTSNDGIFARTAGQDGAGANAGVSIAHSAGAISSSGGAGVKARVGTERQETDTEHADYVAPMNTGLAKVAVTGGSVASRKGAVEAVNYEAGSVVVEVSDGVTLTSMERHGIEAVLHDVGNTAGTVSVTSAGDVTADVLSGIRARNAAGNTVAVTVAVTGGSVTTKGTRVHAVEALQEGTGDAVVNVSDGAAITSRQDAGILARLRLAGNDEGQVKVTQGGTIAGRTGVHANVSRDSVVTIAAGTTTTETREEAAGPVIDVTWTGSFSHGTTATVAQDDSDRWAASDATAALTHHRTVEAGKYDRGDDAGKGTRYGTAAGIEAQVMSWNDVAARVAEGDDPGMIADNAAQTALLAETGAGSRRAAILAAFKAALGNGDIDVADGVFDAVKTGETSLADVTDAEIVTYLSTDDAATRTLLRNVLKYSLSEAEMAVLRAAVTDTGLDAALDDEDAGFSNAYKTAVKAFLDDFNVGDIRVAMNGGSIASRGDGIRAYYATPNDENGAIDVTIAAGTTVSGDMAGIYVANAGAMGTGAARILKQTVTVNGMVTGGSDAAVHLVGGGKLTVGEMGKVRAGSSGTAILVNEPGRSVIRIDGEVRGGAGATAAIKTTGGGSITLGRTGRVTLPEGATNAVRADKATGSDATTDIILVVDAMSVHQGNANEARLGGAVVGNAVPVGEGGRKVVYFVPTTGVGMPVPLRSDGMIDPSGIPCPTGQERGDDGQCRMPPPPPGPTPPPAATPPPATPKKMFCDMAMDKRCRLYEALPSMLLAMNGLPTYQERMAAARSEAGGWARVETARGEWEAESSTRVNVAYDRSRTGVRVGADAPVGEGGRIGLSAHGLRGSAEMTQSGGKARLSGMGVGVHGTTVVGDGVYVDAQAAVTRYDVELTSALTQFGTLKDGAKGTGYALAVEAGRPMALGGNLTLTPSAGLAWSRVSLKDFTDTLSTRVSVEDAGSLLGRAGVGVEMAPADAGGLRVFGSVDVVHEFSAETEAQVSGTALEASAKSTGVRLGVGAVHGWAEGRYAVAGSASYATGGGSSGEFGGGLSLTVRF